jgi:hypothetical protein
MEGKDSKMRNKVRCSQIAVGAVAALALGWLPTLALAHCDTLDGPVVKAARRALEKGDVTPVLKWVKKDHEDEVRSAFERAVRVRAAGPEARALADHYFFETVVRLHRAGEGEPYTGLKPAGIDPGPAVRAADEALEKGSADALVKLLSAELVTGIRERFAHARERQARSEDSIEAGREFVAAYVEFVHYAEGVHAVAAGMVTSHEAGAEPGVERLHEH